MGYYLFGFHTNLTIRSVNLLFFFNEIKMCSHRRKISIVTDFQHEKSTSEQFQVEDDFCTMVT